MSVLPDLVVVVHACQVSPALISSDFYETLIHYSGGHVTSQTNKIDDPYRTKHYPKDEPSVSPDHCPAGGRVPRETVQTEQRTHKYG